MKLKLVIKNSPDHLLTLGVSIQEWREYRKKLIRMPNFKEAFLNELILLVDKVKIQHLSVPAHKTQGVRM